MRIHDKRGARHIREVEGLIDKLNAKLGRRSRTPSAIRTASERIADVLATLEKSPLPARERTARRRAGERGDRQRDRLQQRLRLDLPVQPLHRSVGQQPVPGHPRGRQGRVRGPRRRRDRATCARCASPSSNSTTNTIRRCTTRFFRTLSWADFTPEEMGLMPTVISMGGDGATYDIGFGALSRVLSHLDADQGRGAQHRRLFEHRRPGLDRQPDRPGLGSRRVTAPRIHGKQDERKELALIAAFHPERLRGAELAALQGHFLKHVVEFLNHNDSPAVLDVYTPCQGEQGIADPQANRHGRLAVESRMNPVFVHDPRRGATCTALLARGQPRHRQGLGDDDDRVRRGRRDQAVRDADHAGRLRADRRPVQEAVPPAQADAAGVPVHEYIDLGPAERERQDAVRLVDRRRQEADQGRGRRQDIDSSGRERRRNWRTPAVCSPASTSHKLDADHHVELEALAPQYKEAVEARESSIELDRAGDVRARRLVEGAAGRRPVAAPSAPARLSRPLRCGGRPRRGRRPTARRCRSPKKTSPSAPTARPATRSSRSCSRRRGSSSTARPRKSATSSPARSARVKVTPELKSKIARVAANCDSEIIHEH